MTPHTPDHGGDPTPMHSPVPAGDCPRCGAFCRVILLPAPEIDQVQGSEPGRPCTVCPSCGAPMWLRLVLSPDVARPVSKRTTALVPKEREGKRWEKGTAPTEIIFRADSDAMPPTDSPGSGCA